MNDKLIQALALLYDMEKNNYYMTRSIEKLDAEIQKLAIKKILQRRKSGIHQLLMKIM